MFKAIILFSMVLFVGIASAFGQSSNSDVDILCNIHKRILAVDDQVKEEKSKLISILDEYMTAKRQGSLSKELTRRGNRISLSYPKKISNLSYKLENLNQDKIKDRIVRKYAQNAVLGSMKLLKLELDRLKAIRNADSSLIDKLNQDQDNIKIDIVSNISRSYKALGIDLNRIDALHGGLKH